MKINFKKPFVDNFGNPVREKRGESLQVQEIWRFLAISLFSLSSLKGNPMSAEQKYIAYTLSRRLTDTPDAVECSIEDIAFLKEVCGELLSAGAYGQVVDLIEGKE